MKSISEYIYKRIYEDECINEYVKICGNEIINEAFQSSLLQKLAKAVYDAEKVYNEKEIENNNKLNQTYGWDHKPKISSFSSIFGPKISSNGKIAQGLKWSEIKDKDFESFIEVDKRLIKLVRSSYGNKNGHALFIITSPTGKIVNFAKGYGCAEKTGQTYYFQDDVKWGHGVKELTKSYYTYQQRSLNTNDLIDLMKRLTQNGCIIYVLEITDDMIADYNAKYSERVDLKKGVINYDKKSLENLLKQQKARYSALVKEMKSKKLDENKEQLFDEIGKVQQDVVDTFKLVMSKPENVDKIYNLDDMLQRVTLAYESYYEYVRSDRTYNKRKEHARNRAEKLGGKFSDEEYDIWDYEKENAKNSLIKVQNYLKDAKKSIRKVKDMIAGKYDY